jgi:mannitol/fructose-specific phosphotransferase system IIA component (Ntr-type)
MKLRDFVEPKAVCPQLESTTRDEAIGEMLDALIEAKALDSSLREPVLKKILEREKNGSTGFGKGVAVPHVKHEDIPKMVAAVAVSQPGIDFNALDKQPVYSVFLLLSPADKPDQHLHAMESIFANLQNDNFRKFLRQASTTEEVMELLEEADTQQLT